MGPAAALRIRTACPHCRKERRLPSTPPLRGAQRATWHCRARATRCPTQNQMALWPWTCMSGEMRLDPADLQLRKTLPPLMERDSGKRHSPGDIACGRRGRDDSALGGRVCSGFLECFCVRGADLKAGEKSWGQRQISRNRGHRARGWGPCRAGGAQRAGHGSFP